MSSDPAVDRLLASASFEPIYEGTLVERDRALAERLASFGKRGRANVLLLNATKGVQFYPSIVDFFAILKKALPEVGVVSVSYFADEIHELGPGVAKKGLRLAKVSDVLRCRPAQFDRFDVVLAIGPSDALIELAQMADLRPKLVIVDLGFYHQLLDSTARAFGTPPYLDSRLSKQKKDITCYSCQPESKARREFARVLDPKRISFNWFSYIPIGFRYAKYYRTDSRAFDVALLGTEGRDYRRIDPDRFRGARFVFLGDTERVEDFDRLKSELDLTTFGRVDEGTYAKVLATCRMVLMPCEAFTNNVFLSLVDALASGVPLVANHHIGLSRLEAENAPISFAGEGAISEVATALLSDPKRLAALGQEAIGFARERMDIYLILETILDKEILQ